MENLQSGVILNLLSNMEIQEKSFINDLDDVVDDDDYENRHVTLQITSIIPVLSESDNLYPKQGFFIKVSDSTHELFVSLPQEQDEMILNNKLQIGQFVHVAKLESSYPVPLLKGLSPIPGRKPFNGDFKQLVGIDIMETLSQSSPFQRSAGPGSISPYKTPLRDRRASLGGRNYRTGTHGLNHQGLDIVCSRKKQSLDDSSSCGRRSWCETAKTRTESHVSQVGSARSFSYKDVVSQSSKQVVKSTNRNSNSSSSSTRIASKEPLSEARRRGSSNEQIWTQTEMLWESLPTSLVKLGKQVTRQRDVTLLAAVEALQEAAATDRLLKCLRKFSEIRLEKEDAQQASINEFFKLQEYMVECRMIVQSLTNTSPQRMADGSSREALKLAVDRSRNAATWVKAAVTSDLIPLPASGTKEVKNEAKSTKKPSQITMLKGGYTTTKQRNKGEFDSDSEAEKGNIPDWVKGSALNMAMNLSDSLQDECKTWFLAYMENYIDGFDNECFSKASHSQVAESMCQIKRLNDWLDMMERSNGSSNSKSSDFETYGRVRSKLYEVLLKHVERTAMVLENMNA